MYYLSIAKEKKSGKFLLCYGAKTQTSQKPLPNAMFAFRGFAECPAQQKLVRFLLRYLPSKSAKQPF